MSANIPAIEFEIERLQQSNTRLADALAAAEQQAQTLRAAAANLYDNRLGWSDGRNPYAPPAYWDALGVALERDPAGFCSAAPAPTAEDFLEAIQTEAWGLNLPTPRLARLIAGDESALAPQAGTEGEG